MAMTRRKFLGIAGSTAGTAATAGLLWRLGSDGSGSSSEAVGSSTTTTTRPTSTPTTTPVVTAPTTTIPSSSSRPVLVVVQMSGGNDVLNSLVPTDDGRYRDARPTLGLDAGELVSLAGVRGHQLHRSLGPLGSLWDRDELAIVQGLALPEQSRSHFVALDTWWAGSPELASGGGWLGRWLDSSAPAEPNPLRAIAMGGGAPALTGLDSRPVIVQSLAGFVLEAPRGSNGVVEAFSAMAAPQAGGLLGDAQAAIPDAVQSVETLQAVFDGAIGDVTYEIEALFHAAAAIIAADVGTEVIFINAGGFDTHSDQLSRHVELLGGVANGVEALFERLESNGHADRTLVMAYSEFGRRVAENGSGGTDHGSGGLAFLAGPPVAGRQLVGDIDLGSLQNGDIRPTIDTRSMYADVIDWLGGSSEEILGGRFDSFSLV